MACQNTEGQRVLVILNCGMAFWDCGLDLFAVRQDFDAGVRKKKRFLTLPD